MYLRRKRYVHLDHRDLELQRSHGLLVRDDQVIQNIGCRHIAGLLQHRYKGGGTLDHCVQHDALVLKIVQLIEQIGLILEQFHGSLSEDRV
jgi:hypothetical protein